jgi:two-component system chemotaxis response regulator CheB
MAENQVIGPERVVVLGGSTGSIEVLLDLLPALPSPLPFALVIVLHRKNTGDSTLTTLLSLKTSIPLREVDDKDALLPNAIYVAPADYHLLFEQDGTFSLDDSEKVNFSRPSIDVTFESAADVYGSLLTGILLSGANADGTRGLNAIKNAGGTTVVQRPDTAQVAFMPQQALAGATIDFVVDVPELIALANAIR